MGLIADASIWLDKRHKESLAHSLKLADTAEDFAAAALKAASNPNTIDLLTPNLVAKGMGKLNYHDDGANFVRLGAALAHQPYRLMQVDMDDVAGGLTKTVRSGHTGNELVATVAAFLNDPKNEQSVLAGLAMGCKYLVDSDDLKPEEIAQALTALSYGPLMEDPHTRDAIKQGVAEGAASLMDRQYANRLADIYEEVRGLAPTTTPRRNDFADAFSLGVSLGIPYMAAHNMQDVCDSLRELDSVPDLLRPLVPQIQRDARRILHTYDTNRCEFANIAPQLSGIPHLDFAIASMPESKRMVTFALAETGTNYPMVVEATPQDGLRVTTGCRIYQTPEERISAWTAHADNSRREYAIPNVFAAVAALTACPYKKQAAEATATLTRLGELYWTEWRNVPFSETARNRIEASLARIAPPAI